MARRVSMVIKFNVTMNIEEGEEMDDITSQMYVGYSGGIEHADVYNSEVEDYEITDSK